MKKLISKILTKAGSICYAVAGKLYLPEQKKRVMAWFKIKGDDTLRLDYGLNEDSVVLDVGGYLGEWSSDIFSMYCPIIHIFEPVDDFYQQLKKRFLKNPKIIIHHQGLSDQTKKANIFLDNDGSSTHKNGEQKQKIELISAADFFVNNNIKSVDLMKINIEGEEYDLIEHLISNELIKKISNLQVQFHDFVPDAGKRKDKIQEQLKITHHLTYQYPFVWENWEINNIQK